MATKKFEDIIAWQKGQDIAVEVYALFRDSRNFGFRDQICSATFSISNNIAEGSDRSSNADLKDTYIFLRLLVVKLNRCCIWQKD